MKKKLIQVTITITLLIFSFYYTNKVIDLVRESDPLMRQIKENEEKFIVDAIDATINENTIIPGLQGSKIDYETTYKNMKDYGNYNEILTVFEEVNPTITMDEYYDKYIISGNNTKNEIALVFELNKDTNIEKLTNIYNILNNNNTKATFFIDGLFIEKNINLVKELSNIEIEPLSYNNNYEDIYFNSTISLINDLTNIKPKYCYAEYDKKEVLEICKKNNMHTVIPNIKTDNYPYNSIKEKLVNGSIISMKINSSTQTELPVIIEYITQKGYNLVYLEHLLSEVNNK